ncbi:hypothetical protein HRH25_16260 [Flavisolibacter sp. BT320]|nr:hypothetical protein [Flavisolibacter longurius]
MRNHKKAPTYNSGADVETIGKVSPVLLIILPAGICGIAPLAVGSICASHILGPCTILTADGINPNIRIIFWNSARGVRGIRIVLRTTNKKTHRQQNNRNIE